MAKAPTDGSVISLGDLREDHDNPRRHNPRNIGMIVDSLHEIGPARSIVIDERNNILAGKGTTEAAAQAGFEKVRVVDRRADEIIAVRIKGLSEDQKRRLALYDNRAAELADWDPNVLIELGEEGLLEGVFSQADLAVFLQIGADLALAEGMEDEGDLPARSGDISAKSVTCPSCGHEFIPVK